jgi:hypothetical protein
VHCHQWLQIESSDAGYIISILSWVFTHGEP